MKRVFITGGNGDIGSSIVEIFKINGYEVISPNSKELDLRDSKLIKEYFNHNNNFDIFIHCAGINNPSIIEDLDFNNIKETMQINTFSFYEILKTLIPYQKINGGYILAISSLYGQISRAGRTAYAMSKHALIGLIKTAAIELGKYNIKVNALSPGFVDTNLTRKNNNDEKIKIINESIPLGSIAKPTDIANVSYFLCSEKNTYITGQDITVDGGFICGGFQK
ncbi:SDR family oxidoreductase [uncultured Brachyspira sp.]|uniref:SDR family oxidoreductase n=1 Tax=uncultured Brachyspira sp. TaxID=221953 RepID=UPI00258C8F62|nr:SDR family oxidoreductase [uncultured Brachyspira sp.]